MHTSPVAAAAPNRRCLIFICDPQAHFILDEMVMNGCIIETNKNNILAPVHLLDKAAPS